MTPVVNFEGATLLGGLIPLQWHYLRRVNLMVSKPMEGIECHEKRWGRLSRSFPSFEWLKPGGGERQDRCRGGREDQCDGADVLKM